VAASFRNTLYIEVEGQNILDQAGMCEEIKHFYSNLFSSRVLDTPPDKFQNEDFLNNPLLPRLSDAQHVLLGVLISDNDLFHALLFMTLNWSPGLCGFPSELFRKFWLHLSPFYWQSLDYSLSFGILSPDQRRACI